MPPRQRKPARPPPRSAAVSAMTLEYRWYTVDERQPPSDCLVVIAYEEKGGPTYSLGFRVDDVIVLLYQAGEIPLTRLAKWIALPEAHAYAPLEKPTK